MSGLIMLSALKSGSGKTSFLCGLLALLKQKNISTAAFKAGPDYIDPMFHRTVLGVSSRNLDTFFSDKEQLISLLSDGLAPDTKLAVIEGAMGIYDGMGVTSERGSAYDLAYAVGSPVILLADAKGMGRTLISVLKGVMADDHHHLIKGIILNRISLHYYDMIKPEIEKHTGLSVLGFLPVMEDIAFESRHLGLKLPEEILKIRDKIGKIATQIDETVDIEEIMKIADGCRVSGRNVYQTDDREGPLVAYAYDSAFCFYYQENLEELKKAGARIVPFSPLKDLRLPEKTAGIYLGGGYPELFAKELSDNQSMRKSIKTAIEEHMPSFAECGGFMYLHEAIMSPDGRRSYEMPGAVKSECKNTGKAVRFGYVEMKTEVSTFLPKGQSIKGHEFHYYDSTDNGCDVTAVKPSTGKSYPCIFAGNDHWWGYPHLYFPSDPAFAKCFVDAAKDYADRH